MFQLRFWNASSPLHLRSAQLPSSQKAFQKTWLVSSSRRQRSWVCPSLDLPLWEGSSLAASRLATQVEWWTTSSTLSCTVLAGQCWATWGFAGMRKPLIHCYLLSHRRKLFSDRLCFFFILFNSGQCAAVSLEMDFLKYITSFYMYICMTLCVYSIVKITLFEFCNLQSHLVFNDHSYSVHYILWTHSYKIRIQIQAHRSHKCSYTYIPPRPELMSWRESLFQLEATHRH